jgi:hypothetical protein
MNRQTTRILIATLWLVSLAAVYFLAQNTHSPHDTDSGPPIANATQRGDVSVDRWVGRGVPVGSDSNSPSTDGQEPKNIASLVAQVRVGIGNGDGSLHAFAPFLELDPAQIREALEEVEKTVKETSQRNMLYSVLLEEWARSDGAAAMAFAEEKLKPKAAGIQGAILGRWARTDSDAAWRWYQADRQKISADPNARIMAQDLFRGMAAANVDSALARLGTLDAQERSLGIIGITNATGDQFARGRLLDRSASLEPDLRKQIGQQVVRSWAMNDAEAAVSWLRTRSQEEQADIRPALEKTVMMRDPQRGASLLLEVTPESERPRAYETIVENWAPRDPRGAMEWAKTVADTDQRAATVQRIYSHWKSKDTTAADAALAGSGLAPEQIAEIKQAPFPPKR